MNGDEPALESRDSAARTRAAAAELGLKADVIMALRLFSRLPTGGSPHQKPDLSRIAMALPLASMVIGIGPALLLIGAVLLGMPAYFAAALAVGAMAICSGAMAEDALADAADGLFGGQTPERRLEIMKDSRHGTYGVLAVSLHLLLRVTAVGALAAINPLAAASVWLAASVVGRSAGLGIAVRLPPARKDGASATVGRLPWLPFVVGVVFAAVLLFVLAAPATSVLAIVVAAIAAALTVAGWTALCRRLVGGQTGDLIGAGGGLAELAALAALLPFV